jgi:hypothetical protein
MKGSIMSDTSEVTIRVNACAMLNNEGGIQ